MTENVIVRFKWHGKVYCVTEENLETLLERKAKA
jgi:hypothetical protein